MTTGMIRPAISLFCVRALNCLQNSMMLTWAWPRAGPTGGAGVALPASIWSFTCVCTFFVVGGIAKNLSLKQPLARGYRCQPNSCTAKSSLEADVPQGLKPCFTGFCDYEG